MKGLACTAAVALALAGCATATEPVVTPTGTTTTDEAPVNASFSCDAVSQDDLATFSIGIQLLAQITDQDQLDGARDNPLWSYDPTEMDRILHALVGLPETELFGDPDEDLQFYIEANDIVANMYTLDGPVAQEDFDALAAYNGDLAGFIVRQTSINAALDNSCN